jgi:DNA-binding transcriptional LysR family regulator
VASSFDPLILLAELGAGLVCVPDVLVRRQLVAGSLVALLARQVEQTETIRAVWPSNRYAAPKLRVFVDFLSRNLTTRDHKADLAQVREPRSHVDKTGRDALLLADSRSAALS